MKYRKKPVVIDAVEITREWFYGADPQILGVLIDPIRRCVIISTLEGEMRGDIGDFLITGVNGEKYPCKPDIFHKTYEEAQ